MNAKKYLTLINEQRDGVKGGEEVGKKGANEEDIRPRHLPVFCAVFYKHAIFLLLLLFVGFPLLPLQLLPLSLYCSRCIV